jgi:hypothetical protein
MKHVAIPTTSMDGSKQLTTDQRHLLIILEDATLMSVRDEIQFLRSLPEKLKPLYGIKEGGEE